MKKILGILLVGVASVLFFYFVGTKEAPVEVKVENEPKNYKQWDKPPEMTVDANKIYTATIETSKGIIKADLFVKETPNAVNNFVFLARENFYVNLKFHRIMKGFMVQTGDPEGNGTGGPGYKFDDEKVTRDYKRGILAMANSGSNTNGSQFFIIDKDTDLPKAYTTFGEIKPSDEASFKTLDAIAETPVEKNINGEDSKPKEEVLLKSITIEEIENK